MFITKISNVYINKINAHSALKRRRPRRLQFKSSSFPKRMCVSNQKKNIYFFAHHDRRQFKNHLAHTMLNALYARLEKTNLMTSPCQHINRNIQILVYRSLSLASSRDYFCFFVFFFS